MNKITDYDILVKFTYEDEDYVIYTDNTYNKLGEYNIYGAKLGFDDKLEKVDDVDMDDVFKIVIDEYREKIVAGEI